MPKTINITNKKPPIPNTFAAIGTMAPITETTVLNDIANTSNPSPCLRWYRLSSPAGLFPEKRQAAIIFPRNSNQTVLLNTCFFAF